MTTVRRPLSGPLWRNRDFVRLWTGQAFAQFGSNVSMVVLPLLAIGTLHAGTAEVGVLGLASRLPLVLYIVAGVWVDRVRKRPILIGTSLIRSVLLLLIPVEAAAGMLSVAVLAVTLFTSGVLMVWYDTAYLSYLPTLVSREHLVDGNSRLESARATAQVAGAGIGGVLVQAVTAPIAVILDGMTLLASAAMVGRIRKAEPEPVAGPRGTRGARTDLMEGFRFFVRDPVLRPLAVAIAVSNFAWAAEGTLYVVYLVTTLGMPPSLVGLTLAGAGPGAMAGALAASRVARGIGVPAAITSGLTVFTLGTLVIPFAPGNAGVAVPALIVAGFVMAAGGQVCSVNVMSLRQVRTPDHLQGRVNGSFRFLAYGLAPLGALAGGLAGTLMGSRTALFAAVAMMGVAPLMVWFSPVRRVRDLPGMEAER